MNKNWYITKIRKTAFANEAAALQEWIRSNSLEISNESINSVLRPTLGKIVFDLNKISLLIKNSVKKGITPELILEAQSVLPRIPNIDQIKELSNQTFSLLQSKADQNSYSGISVAKNLAHYIANIHFGEQQASQIRSVANNSVQNSQYNPEEDTEATSNILANAIYGSVANTTEEVKTVFREILQNSADAARLRHQQNQTIRPLITIQTSLIPGNEFMDAIVTDNGVGMDWNIVANKFFVLGASGKTGQEASTGGFGIAKAKIMTTPQEGWAVDTGGIHTNQFNKNIFHTMKQGDPYVPPVSRVSTAEVKGTTLSLFKLPKLDDWQLKNVLNLFAGDDLDITLNGTEIVPKFKISEFFNIVNPDSLVQALLTQDNESILSKNKNSDSFVSLSKKITPQEIGKTKIQFFIKRSQSGYGGQVHYMLNQQFQFTSGYCSLADIIVYMTTTSRPGEKDYPVSAGRDSLRDTIKNKIENIITDLQFFLSMIASSELLFKEGVDTYEYNESLPPLTTSRHQKNTTYNNFQKTFENAISIGSSLGYASPMNTEVEDQLNTSPIDNNTTMDSEELASRLTNAANNLNLKDREKYIITAFASALESERDDGIKVAQQVQQIIEALSSPALVQVQSNFVSKNFVKDDAVFTSSLLVCWQQILKYIVAGLKTKQDLQYDEYDFIPGLIYSDKCLALFQPPNKEKKIRYNTISINPMTVAAIVDPDLFNKEIIGSIINKNEDKVVDFSGPSDFAEVQDESGNPEKIMPTARLAAFLFHEAVHELCHMYYPDFGDRYEGFHSNISKLENYMHFAQQGIYQIVKRHMKRLKQDSVKLIRAVRDDRRVMLGQDPVKRGRKPGQTTANWFGVINKKSF